MSMNKILEEIYKEAQEQANKGRVATYIPELAQADIGSLGLVLIDENKNIYKYGDFDLGFTIQSISKPISLILALEDWGLDIFTTKVGLKPSDRAFNSYVELEAEGSLPANPMINSGAITTTGLIKGDRLARILDFIEENLGEEISYNSRVYLSERETGDRNKALAYLLRSKGLMGADFLEALDTYFKQCSIQLNLIQLAKLYYPLSQGGINYFDKKILTKARVSQINALMLTAGMYDNSGEYALRVGLPSKSGVAGGLVAIVPKKAVIAVYSPGLDLAGNSVLGQFIMEKISKQLAYNIFD